jgi:hypothetical protein
MLKDYIKRPILAIEGNESIIIRTINLRTDLLQVKRMFPLMLIELESEIMANQRLKTAKCI